ncbi:hypothetical protein L3Q82_013755 [Scortum barcoo]|uniref:Uncharacterized protein n=1 Tax=Scortum barcoo TaxID=214431 RepID=A0ACB8W1E1_9TELE|nr:hypothetical protein L3Q82_013755 [Scortum barcoo]
MQIEAKLLLLKLTFQVPRPFSAHTDNMLGTLCTLITALTCVSGVTVLTQKPPVVTVRKGETATMDCNLGTVTDQSAHVDAAKVLTQTPAVHTVSTGQEVVLRCNIQRYDNEASVSWYKQVPGEAPQFVLAFHHGSSSLEFGSGFSSDRFNSKSSSNIDYQFIIKKVRGRRLCCVLLSNMGRLCCPKTHQGGRITEIKINT